MKAKSATKQHTKTQSKLPNFHRKSTSLQLLCVIFAQSKNQAIEENFNTLFHQNYTFIFMFQQEDIFSYGRKLPMTKITPLNKGPNKSNSSQSRAGLTKKRIAANTGNHVSYSAQING